MSTIMIGPYKFSVLKIDGNRLLLSWITRDGIYNERWVINKGVINV
jgi:hypothetical protein